MRKNSLIALGLLFVLWAEAGIASEHTDSYFLPRSMGMGGASTALANDGSASWTNPAGIARVRKARSRHGIHILAVPNLTLGGNPEGQSVLGKMQLGSAALGSAQTSELIEGLEANADKPIAARLMINPQILFDAPKGSPWAVGLFAASRLQVLVDDSAAIPLAQVNAVSDVGANIGMAWTNRTNRVNLGITMRPTTRYDFNDKVELPTLVNKSEMTSKIQSESNTVQGVGADIGFMWTLADFWFPTLGVAVRNLPTGCVNEYLNPFMEVRQMICGTKFSGSVKNPESTSLVDATDFRIGMSITPRITQKIALRFAFDVQHMHLTPDDKQFFGLPGIDPLRMIRAGVELFVGNPLQPSPFALRTGLSEGFVTAGASMRVHVLTLEFASYGQNISKTSAPREDRRQLLGVTAEF